MATADSVKAKIQGLIDKVNEVTGQKNTDLTSAINTLVAGANGGAGAIKLVDVAELPEIYTAEMYEYNSSTDEVASITEAVTAQGITLTVKVVDVLPQTYEISSGTVAYIYVLRSTGIPYMSTDGTTPILALDAFNGSGVTEDLFRGIVDSVDEMTTDGIYTIITEVSIDTEPVYRCPAPALAGVYVVPGAGTTPITVEDYFKADGMQTIEVFYYLVDALPEEFEYTSVDTSTMSAVCHVYVLKDSGFAYVSVDGETSIPAVSLGQGTDSGWADSTSEMTETGTYTLRGSGYECYKYKDGEWVNAEIDPEAIYYSSETEISAEVCIVLPDFKGTLIEFFAREGVTATLPVYVVDELPGTMEPVDEATITMPIYVLRDTGVAYVSDAATVTTLGTMFGGMPDKGWIDDIDSVDTSLEENYGLYTVPVGGGESYTFHTYKDGVWTDYSESGGVVEVDELPTEDIDQDAVYKMKSAPSVTALISHTKGSTDDGDYLAYYRLLGATVVFNYVDALPTTLATIDGSYLPFYVVNSTGIVYFSQNGTTPIPFGLQMGMVDHGWSSTPPTVDAESGVYTIGSAGGTVYGIPNSAGGKKIYEYGTEWVDLSTLSDKVATLESERVDLTTQVNILEGEKADLQEEVADKTASANFVDYAVLGISEYGVALTGVTNTTIESIKIPNGVNAIESLSGPYLKKVVIPPSVSYINTSNISVVLYGGLPSLNIYITDLAAWCSCVKTRRNSSQAFYYLCLNEEVITDLVIPEGVVSIEEFAFTGCSIESVVIPDSVVDIKNHAFYNDFMQSVELGNGVKTIGSYAFYGNLITNLTIPDSVEEIQTCAFDECAELTDLNLGNGVKIIGGNAFFGAAITSIEIPDSVETISEGAFCCNKATSINIGAGVTSLSNLFYYPTQTNGGALESIYVQSGNTTYHSEDNCIIETSTNKLIKGCRTSVIPSGVTTIGACAFYRERNLTSITIPASVTVIQVGAFSSTGLTNITYTGTKEQWKAIEKEGDWDFYMPDYVVTCTDGTIAKDGTET